MASDFDYTASKPDTSLDDRELGVPKYSEVCLLCTNYQQDNFCRAFPDGAGIPLEIWTGKNNHQQPYPGDNGIQFEQRGDNGQ